MVFAKISLPGGSITLRSVCVCRSCASLFRNYNSAQNKQDICRIRLYYYKSKGLGYFFSQGREGSGNID